MPGLAEAVCLPVTRSTVWSVGRPFALLRNIFVDDNSEETSGKFFVSNSAIDGPENREKSNRLLKLVVIIGLKVAASHRLIESRFAFSLCNLLVPRRGPKSNQSSYWLFISAAAGQAIRHFFLYKSAN